MTRFNRHKNTWGKKLAALGGFSAILGAAGTGLYFYEPEITLDEQYCTNQPIHEVGVWIDYSLGRLTATQLRDYRTGLMRAYQTAPSNSKIMVFTTASDESSSLSEPSYAQCKPPATIGEYKANGLSEKPAPFINRQVKEAEKTYSQQIETILSNVQTLEKAAAQSPILEQIKGISHYQGFQGQSRSLTILTDGIQNSTNTGMFCRDQEAMPRFSNFAQRSDYAINFKPASFQNTDVSVLLVEQMPLPNPQMSYCSSNELRRFWLDYFKGNQAKSVTLTPLQSWGQ